MRFLRQSLTGLFLASLTLALLIYAGQLVFGAVQDRMAAEQTRPPAQERVFAVNVVTAELETHHPELEAFGEVQSLRTLELRAAVTGRVVALSDDFVEGGNIETGTLLMQIDPADSEAALERAQTDLLDAQAEKRDAERAILLARDELVASEAQSSLRERAFQRQRDLVARGVGSAAAEEAAELSAASARQAVLSRRIALSQAESRVDLAQTRVSRARIALEEARRDLADTAVTAPFDGTLSDVSLVEGRLVQSNEKIAVLVDPDALEVAFRVSTTQYARLLDPAGQLIGADVTVTLDAAGAALEAEGRISRDSGTSGEGLSGRLIFAQLEKAPGFKPGDFVTVRVAEPPLHQVARLPASALDASGSVLVVDADDRLEEVPVELVRRQGDDVLLRSEALAGREVVIGRTPLLGEGIKVRPLRAEPSAEAALPAMMELTAERRARLVAFVSASTRLPEAAKARVLSQLDADRVPTRLVERIEARMGG